ncbi:MAG: SEC-C domain-containing protein [Alphaproteobacteria bacterium]|nr:SEC-C domain-containing protein [Alphaproteobacteria bacterium]
MTSACPCGSGRGFDDCCAPLLAGQPAPSPEALMRSRYSAFVKGDVAYLGTTLAPEALVDYDPKETEALVEAARWQGLEIRSSGIDETGEKGHVEFVARYTAGGKPYVHHELGSFRTVEGRWLYVDGVMNPRPPQRVVANKVGRNDPCPCGSGQKFKKCCGA